MAQSKVDLDRQAVGKNFTFGAATAGNQAAVVIEKGTAALTTEVIDVKGSQRIRGNLALEGDLVITGSVDSQAVTNTNVKDKTITVNDGGTTTGAAGAGVVVEGDAGATIGQISFDNALANKFAIGNGTTQKAIVVTDDARLSDARTPTTHTHTKAQITDFAHTHVATTDLTATGTKDATTFLRGDNTWAAPAGGGATFTRRTITGTINGVNTAFTLGVTPAPAGSEMIMQNGLTLLPGSGNDYTITGATVTFAVAPATGDQLQAFASA